MARTDGSGRQRPKTYADDFKRDAVRLVTEQRYSIAAADQPPLNGSTSGARILVGRTFGRAIDATREARAGGSDHPQAA